MQKDKSAGAVIYRIDENGKLFFLLLLPAIGKPWGFAKGRMKAGESEVEAALREIFEETGLTNIELDSEFRTSIYYKFRGNKGNVAKEVVYFLAKSAGSQIILSHEHIDFRWETYETAFSMLVFKNATQLLAQVRKRLNCLEIMEEDSV